jgi:hypothetical protein
MAMINTTLDYLNARPNVIIDGKLYIPRNQWETYIEDDVEKIRFTYIEGRTYNWREPHGIFATWGDASSLTLKDFAKVLQIKGYSESVKQFSKDESESIKKLESETEKARKKSMDQTVSDNKEMMSTVVDKTTCKIKDT